MSTSDSATSTPLILTPDSTGSGDISSSIKKARRQTAFYPNVNSSNKQQKPFSRSAAKRESVMMLGSIEHLQHYFTKTGIAAKKNPSSKGNKGMVPALGGTSHVRGSPSLTVLPEFDLPQTPAMPSLTTQPSFPSGVKTYDIDPQSLLPGVVEDLTDVANAWCIKEDHASSPPPHDPSLLGVDAHRRGSVPEVDVLALLKTTTRAVRSVRNYVVSLPDESAGTLRAQFRPSHLASSLPVHKRLTSQSNAPSDPLTLIRKYALEVLTVLRELEEISRVPLSDDAYDAQSDRSGSSQGGRGHHRVASPSVHSDEPDNGEDELAEGDTSISYMQVQGRFESVPVWEDENHVFDISEEEQEKPEPWDERLVIGSGWLYKQDLRVEDIDKERAVVMSYLTVVDEVLFGGEKNGRRGWEHQGERSDRREREGKVQGRRVSTGDAERQGNFLQANPSRSARRVISTGMLDAMRDMAVTEEPEEMAHSSETESLDDYDLPEWAKRGSFEGNEIGRTHAILEAYLPADLLSLLCPPSDRTAFFQLLSSGQMLCVAYNACVRKSRKPWGYISRDSIHDIFALERTAVEDHAKDAEKAEKVKRGWTFRRSDNLRLWAGALKLRYLLPVLAPKSALGVIKPSGTPTSSPLPSPSASRFSTHEVPIVFDPAIVARKDDGWEDMLEALVIRWTAVVTEEKRTER